MSGGTAVEPAAGAKSAQPSKRRDLRPLALLIVVAGIALLGYLVTLLPTKQYAAPSGAREQLKVTAFDSLASQPEQGRSAGGPESELSAAPQRHHAEARRLLSAGKYNEAIASLNLARSEIQHLPQSYLLIGLALLGKQDYRTARDFFNAAIDRDPSIAESYFGFAVAAEGLGELDQALSGMRTFLHLQTDPDPYRLKVAQARAAIWEWESRLGRGEWGPTRGIPQGFTEAELRRDKRGVGTKIPIPGSEDARGFSRYTIKHSDNIRMFER